MRSGAVPPTPFVLAYRAVEDGDRAGLAELLDRHPELVRRRGTNGNDLLGMAGDHALVALLLEHGADPNRGNDYGWTKLHQAGYGNDRELARMLLAAGGRLDLSARGDGGTPLVVALFWGHREVAELLGREPGNLRAAPGLDRRGSFGGPAHGEGVTALHLAAQSGHRDAVLALLELGADPLLVDDLHGGRPRGWATVGGHPEIAELLP